MEYLIGVVQAIVVCALAMLGGYDRERLFYPAMLIPIPRTTFCSL